MGSRHSTHDIAIHFPLAEVDERDEEDTAEIVEELSVLLGDFVDIRRVTEGGAADAQRSAQPDHIVEQRTHMPMSDRKTRCTGLAYRRKATARGCVGCRRRAGRAK